jgi:hypothetical protein
MQEAVREKLLVPVDISRAIHGREGGDETEVQS